MTMISATVRKDPRTAALRARLACTMAVPMGAPMTEQTRTAAPMAARTTERKDPLMAVLLGNLEFTMVVQMGEPTAALGAERSALSNHRTYA